MRVLDNLVPEKVFYYFEELCNIPHGSTNTKAISDYCVNFAKERGLAYHQDAENNIIILKNGSKGYEDSKPVGRCYCTVERSKCRWSFLGNVLR